MAIKRALSNFREKKAVISRPDKKETEPFIQLLSPQRV